MSDREPTECPRCGEELTVRTIYGKYTEVECERCGYEYDNAPAEAHFGSGYY